jgi:hypothetical protein
MKKKFCDRCLEEYDEQEIVKFKLCTDKEICIPCSREFDRMYEEFIITFFIQPERLSERDTIFSVFDSLNTTYR